MNRIQRIAAAAGAVTAMAAVVGTGAVLALDRDGGGSSSQALAAASSPQDASAFLKQLALNLGIDEQALTDAIKQTNLDMVDQALANGDISQDDADRLKEKIEAGGTHLFSFGVPFGKHGGPGHEFGPFPGPGNLLDGVATFLGTTDEQLRTDLADKTLAEVAEAHGKTRDELEAFVTGKANAAIDAAVAADKLTSDEGAAAKQRFADSVDKLLDARVRMFKFEMRGPGGPRRFHGWPLPDTGSGSTSGSGTTLYN